MFPDTIDNIGPAYVGAGAPASAATGDLWFNTTDPERPVLMVYVAPDWFPATPPAAGLLSLPVVDPGSNPNPAAR